MADVKRQLFPRHAGCIALFASACTILAFLPFGETSLGAQQAPSARVVQLPVSLDLGPIRWALPISGQRVIFSDDGSNLVYIRQADGSTTQLGRHGDGPGEYRAPENGILKGDSILIFAPGLSKRTAIHLQTGTGTTRQMLGVTPDAACRSLILITSEGICELPRRGDPRATDHSRAYMRYSTVGATAGMVPLYRHFDTAHVTVLVDGTRRLGLGKPFSWAPSGLLSPSGTRAFVLQQRLVGGMVEVTVTVTDVVSGRRTIHGFVAPPSSASAAAVRAEARRIVMELGEQGHPIATDPDRSVARIVAGWALPSDAPPYSRVRGSDDGCFWLERNRPFGTALPLGITHDRYDAIGRQLASVTIPLEVFIHSVNCTMAIGARTDDDGVPDLVRVEPPDGE